MTRKDRKDEKWNFDARVGKYDGMRSFQGGWVPWVGRALLVRFVRERRLKTKVFNPTRDRGKGRGDLSAPQETSTPPILRASEPPGSNAASAGHAKR